MLGYLIILFVCLMQPSSDELRKGYINDYKKIAEAYKKRETLSFRVTYRSFDRSPNKADTTFYARFVMRGNMFYSKMGSSETYKNSRYYVAVNHDLKMISVNYAKVASPQPLPFEKIDTALKLLNTKISYATVGDDHLTGQYVIETKEQGDVAQNKSIIEFNKTTYLITRYVVSMYGWDADPYNPVQSSFVPYAEMLFSNYSGVPVADDVFSTKKYFTEQTNGTVLLRAPYTEYKLINSLPYNLEK